MPLLSLVTKKKGSSLKWNTVKYSRNANICCFFWLTQHQSNKETNSVSHFFYSSQDISTAKKKKNPKRFLNSFICIYCFYRNIVFSLLWTCSLNRFEKYNTSYRTNEIHRNEPTDLSLTLVLNTTITTGFLEKNSMFFFLGICWAWKINWTLMSSK